MAGSVNKVILIDNLGADPEVRSLPSGDPVVNLSLATNRKWTDRDSGDRVASWWGVVCRTRSPRSTARSSR